MTDRPIIFSAPMVRALIEGRKTQTRRLVKNVPDMPAANCHPAHVAKHPAPYLDAYCGERVTPANPRGMGRDWHWWQVDDRCGPRAFRLPYAPGDRLWVREAWGINDSLYEHPIPKARPADLEQGGLCYLATETDSETRLELRWRPSIHMPRWASRLTLTVTDVRVQRLQDITEADAAAEGVEATRVTEAEILTVPSFLPFFRSLWNSIHGPEAWEANRWVCALTFTVRQGNIDT